MKNLIVAALILMTLVPIRSWAQMEPQNEGANSAKLFTRSVVYGTLAGTLVGFATLAFTSNPGGNLNNVARGASYGLYAGILLGAYIVYGVPDAPEEGDQGPSLYEGVAPDGMGAPPPGSDARKEVPAIAFIPILPTSSFSLGTGGLLQGSIRF